MTLEFFLTLRKLILETGLPEPLPIDLVLLAASIVLYDAYA